MSAPQVQWSELPPTSVGWWWHYPSKGSGHERRVRPMRVIEHKKILMLEVHAGCLFDGYPGLWAGPIEMPDKPA